MRIVTLDFETFFDSAYSLSKMSTEAYVRDPRFAVHGAAIKWGPDYAARWYDARQLKQVLNDEDWSNSAMLCHHVQFDGFILSQHYGIRPRLWLDTLSMARLCLGNHVSVSLDSVRAHFGLAVKRTPYERFKGRHWHELDQQTKDLIADGCCDEVESIYLIFNKLAAVFPRAEYEVIDLTIRMFTEPVLRADTALLAQLWEQEERGKNDLLAELGVTAAALASAQRFADLLVAAGVEEITTKSGKNGAIPAFAKTDHFMRELLEHDDPRIRGLVAARLGIKSTLEQTRAETLGFMSQRGALAVYLRYCGAHTTRWSGGDGSNFQNFKRGSQLRRAIQAPAGYLLATADLSQIECRILNYLAGQDDVIEKFRAGADPYVGLASLFYGRPITKADAPERGTGKQAELSCGYGCGWRRFQAVARLGSYGPPVKLTDADSDRAVKLYRTTHPRVVKLWHGASCLLEPIANRLDWDFLPCLQVADGKLYLPNGAWLNYQTLEWYQPKKIEDTLTAQGKPKPPEDCFWRLKTRHGWQKMYGAKLVENFVQALARVVMSDAAIRIARAGLRPVLSSHDELSFLVKDDSHQAEALDFIKREMTRTPSWLPGMPIACEAALSPCYGK